MFTFLNSLFAWGLLAATIPLLIHLLTRKKLKTIPFSTVQFLKRLQKAKIRQIRLKQLLLLLLRTVIILCIAFAFMRPTVNSEKSFLGKKAKSTTIFIIDNSLSMAATIQGESLLSKAKSVALNLLSLNNPGDVIAVIQLATVPRLVLSTTKQTTAQRFESAMNTIVQTDGSSPIFGALKIARQFIAEKRNLNNNIYILSDKKFTESRGDIDIPANVHVYFINLLDTKIHNLSVGQPVIDNKIFTAGRVVNVEAPVFNSGDFNEENLVITLSVNGKRVAQRAVTLKSGHEKSVQLKFVPPASGLYQLTVSSENDQLRQDNYAYTLFSIPEKFRVLLVTPSREDSRFIRYALENRDKNSQFAIKEIQPADIAATNFGEQDIVISCNVSAFKAADLAKIDNFVRRGGGFLLFLGDAVDFRNYEQTVFQRLHLGSVVETVGSPNAGAGSLRFGDISLNHALFTGIFEAQNKAGKIDSPSFLFAPRLRPQNESRTLIRYSNGSPLLLENSQNPGLIFACLTAADPSWSDFVYKPIFAPLVDRMVRLAAQSVQNDYALIKVGTKAVAAVKQQKSTAFFVSNPHGTRFFLKPEVENGQYKVTIDETQFAGFYHVFEQDQQRFTFAANYGIEEMRQGVTDDDRLIDALRNAELTFVDYDDKIVETIRQNLAGNELGALFLILALAGLIIEMFIYRAKNVA